jgi:hypothetical protein
LSTFLGPPGDLDLHRLLRQPQLKGDIPLGYSLELAEDEDFTATAGQRIDGVEEHSDFLTDADPFDDIGAFFYDALHRKISYRQVGKYFRATEKRDGGVAGRGKEVSLGAGYLPTLPGAKHAQIALLHQIVDIPDIAKPAVQISPQGWFVRLKLVGKPLGSL